MVKDIKVVVCGACGKMGQSVIKAVTADAGVTLVAAVDRANNPDIGKDIGTICGIGEVGVKLTSSLNEAFAETSPDVMVDFTMPEIVFANSQLALKSGIRPVIGTTGMSKDDINELRNLSKQNGLGAIVAPNFAIGAVLLMKFAKEASKYFEYSEIIEIHHDKKLDAPSGTAIKTAELMSEARKEFGRDSVKGTETVPGSRGGVADGNIHIHSVRLPSMVAHEEVLLSGTGQLLTIRHDSFDRTSFMPGVLVSIKKVMEIDHLIYGLENIL